MQRIERYGVITLLLVFVTIIAVYLWDDDEPVPDETAQASPAALERHEPARLRDQLFPVPSQSREALALPLSGEEAVLRVNVSEPLTQSVPRSEDPTDARSRNPVTDAPELDPESARRERFQAARRREGRLSEPEREARVVEDSETESVRLAIHRSEPLERPAREIAADTGREYREVFVEKGDTLAGIAARELGDSKLWREIQAFNGNLDPRRLFVGARVKIPSRSGGFRAGEERRELPAVPGSKRSYVVQKNDILGRIAQRELGSATRWPEIVALNPGLDPDHLIVGKRLVLPGSPIADRSSTVVAQVKPSEARSRVR